MASDGKKNVPPTAYHDEPTPNICTAVAGREAPIWVSSFGKFLKIQFIFRYILKDASVTVDWHFLSVVVASGQLIDIWITVILSIDLQIMCFDAAQLVSAAPLSVLIAPPE